MSFTSTLGGDDFDSVFTEVDHDRQLVMRNPSSVRLFCLKVSSSRFDYARLEDFIRDNIGEYVLSRAEIAELEEKGKGHTISNRGRRILRQHSSSKRALGEVLLYFFLEKVLNAPKVLSKVEIAKKSFNLSTCDAIHLLLPTPGGFSRCNLVFGTSQLKNNMTSALDEVFRRVVDIENNSKNECQLAEETVFARDAQSGQDQKILDLLMPSEQPTSGYDTAYGLFVGCNLGIDSRRYSAEEYQQKVVDKLRTDIEGHVDEIKKRIEKYGLDSHSFYIFILPLHDTEQDKISIIDAALE